MWQTLLSVVIGGILAIAGGVWTQSLQRRHERRSLAYALAGEISAILRIIESRNYERDAEMMIKVIQMNKAPAKFTLHVTQDYFTVFQGSCTKIGVLPPKLAEDVAKFYTFAKSLVEDATDGHPAVTDYPQAMVVLQEQLKLLKEMIATGTRIVPLLQGV